MKANELRIGNWFHADTQLQPNYLQIKARDILELSIDPQDDYYKPIHLTEEWLVKFEYDKEAFRLTVNGRGVWTVEMCWTSWAGVNEEWRMIQTLINVHEWQNLYFALTSEELEIKE